MPFTHAQFAGIYGVSSYFRDAKPVDYDHQREYSAREDRLKSSMPGTFASMNAMIQHRSEVDVGNIEATEAKLDALRDSLDETKKDIRELRGDVNSLRDKVDRNHGEMHAGFAALRQSMADMHASLQANIAGVQASIAGLQASVAELRATMKTVFWAVSVAGMLATIFFTAGKALHWF